MADKPDQFSLGSHKSSSKPSLTGASNLALLSTHGNIVYRDLLTLFTAHYFYSLTRRRDGGGRFLVELTAKHDFWILTGVSCCMWKGTIWMLI